MQSIYPLTTSIFKEKAKQPVSKLEVTIGDGADSIDLYNFYGKCYVKEVQYSSGMRDLSNYLVAADITATIDDTDGLFHPLNTDSPFYSFLKIGEKITFSTGFMIDGVKHLWQWFVGVISSVEIDRSNKQLVLKGFDYTQYLKEVKLKSPDNYWGTSVTKSTVADQAAYDMPVDCNGTYIAYLDGVQIYDQYQWIYDREGNQFIFLPDYVPSSNGTNNLIIYYYTDQIPEEVVADILVTSGRYPTQASALLDMDYEATGITLARVRFSAGTSAFSAINQICERCDYEFFFKYNAVPLFKPIE